MGNGVNNAGRPRRNSADFANRAIGVMLANEQNPGQPQPLPVGITPELMTRARRRVYTTHLNNEQVQEDFREAISTLINANNGNALEALLSITNATLDDPAKANAVGAVIRGLIDESLEVVNYTIREKDNFLNQDP